MKVIITGKNGQLGRELSRTQPNSVDARFFDSSELDITRADKVQRKLREIQPDLVINAAAYTAVDKAESDSAGAFQVNRDGVANLAHACQEVGARLIHVSTDFVFSGDKGSPYEANDGTAPQGVYGQSKLEGEQRCVEILGDSATIIRTAWVYSVHGNNFVKTMLRLMSERDQLGVIEDQVGTPTWARNLALAVWAASEQKIGGIHHWTDAGAASWYDFAQAILEESVALGLINAKVEAVKPIQTVDYPTPAKRPAYSVLRKSPQLRADAPIMHWREALRHMLREMQSAD